MTKRNPIWRDVATKGEEGDAGELNEYFGENNGMDKCYMVYLTRL
jgi:hypothetical protein